MRVSVRLEGGNDMAEGSGTDAPGIEVDDAAMYFGVTDSSDMLHAMMGMPKEAAFLKFFELLSDIVLQPGDFDFEAASERMQCEGGEIYYLVAGHLGLMSMPDPLLDALGMPNSTGEAASTATGSINEAQRAELERLADPMRMMKLFAVAHQTGGSDEVKNYLSGLNALLSNVAGSAEGLMTVNHELDAALDVAGHILPIPSLSSGAAAAATVSVPDASIALPLPESPPPAAAPPAAAPPAVNPAVEEEKVPLPSAPLPEPASEPAPAPPMAAAAVELPKVESNQTEEPAVNMENDRQVARATQDAFSGAFSSVLLPEDDPVAKAVVSEASAPIETGEVGAPVGSEPVGPGEGDEFVSAAEHFIAADGDGSGALDVEELASATGTSIEEAAELHAEADTDGDGVVSLSEFISSPAAERTAALPKPVAPVRKPLASNQAPAQQQPAPVQQRPQPLPQQPWQQQPPQQAQPQQQQPWQQQQQGWQQPPQQQGQRPGWPQPQAPMIQPTIRSGIHCRGCGIGLDPYWRFCPVCGQQNLGY
jgi:hypothetical protein